MVFKREMPKKQIIPWDANKALELWQKRHSDTGEPLPDVFAIKDDSILSIEVKAQERYAYYKKAQVKKLFEFLEIHKIYPRRYAVLAGKFKYKGWWFDIATKLDDYMIKIDKGMTWNELLAKIS